MFHDPVEERLFKADVAARLLALDPFVAEDFLPLREELFVEQGFFDEVGIFVGGVAHIGYANFYKAAFASMFLTGSDGARALTASPPDAYAEEYFVPAFLLFAKVAIGAAEMHYLRLRAAHPIHVRPRNAQASD